MVASKPKPPESTAPAGFARSLSRAIDHAVVQAEAAEHVGDASVAQAWRRVLRDLGQTIPESRP